MPTTPATSPAQGDLRLLDAPVARDLLGRAIPARMAYIDRAGEPRIVPTWFHWTGDELVMPTWRSGPHIRHPARRLRDLAEHPKVAISIDTEDQPPVVLQIRGQATIDDVDGLAEEYRWSARRYLGEEAAGEFLAQFDGVPVGMARIVVRPEWVGLIDFGERLPGPLGGVAGAG